MSFDDTVSDADLIRAYLDDSDQSAFEALLNRHYNRVYYRALKSCRNKADAEDITQQVWIRILDSLPKYTDEGKFPNYVETVTRNIITDYWRHHGIRKDNAHLEDENLDAALAQSGDVSPDIADQLIHQEAIDYLTGTLIPSLPTDQRMIFLLKHESEYWEEKQRLEWNQLASMNGMDVDRAWRGFEQVRNDLLSGARKPNEEEADDVLIYMVWTQAQRPHKKQRYTEQYFADLLNMPVNTLKTRYRAAAKALADGMQQWQEARS